MVERGWQIFFYLLDHIGSIHSRGSGFLQIYRDASCLFVPAKTDNKYLPVKITDYFTFL